MKDTGGESEAEPLEMENVVGIFYVLGMGMALGLIGAFIDVLLETRTVSKENEVGRATFCPLSCIAA